MSPCADGAASASATDAASVERLLALATGDDDGLATLAACALGRAVKALESHPVEPSIARIKAATPALLPALACPDSMRAAPLDLEDLAGPE